MKKINYSIQGLRGLFALGVLLSHCSFLGNYAQSASSYDNIFSKLANVSFFFILSGFFALKSQSGSVKFFEFLKKKMFRIYPLYLMILLVVVAFKILTSSFETSPDKMVSLLLNIFLLQGWGGLSAATGFYTVSWFLSSLIFCYIVGYWLCKLIKSNPSKAWLLIYSLAAILIAFKCIAAICFPNSNTGYYLCYLFPPAGLADFLLGMIIAQHINKLKLNDRTILMLQIAAIAVLIVSYMLKLWLPRNYCRAFLMIPANILIVLSFNIETAFSKVAFGNKIMAFIGDISFEIYLSHVLIISMLSKIPIFNRVSASVSPFLTLILFICICVLCAYIYKVVFKWITQKMSKKHT